MANILSSGANFPQYIPKVGTGDPISYADINGLASAIFRNSIQSVNGAGVSRTTSGISIRPDEDPNTARPFTVSIVTDGESTMVNVVSGQVVNNLIEDTEIRKIFSWDPDDDTSVPYGNVMCDVDGHTKSKSAPYSFTFDPNGGDCLVWIDCPPSGIAKIKYSSIDEYKTARDENFRVGIPVAYVTANLNVIQLSYGDYIVDVGNRDMHPFQCAIRKQNLIIKQGFVYSYPTVVDVGIGSWENAVKLSENMLKSAIDISTLETRSSKSSKKKDKADKKIKKKDYEKYLLDENLKAYKIPFKDNAAWVFLKLKREDYHASTTKSVQKIDSTTKKPVTDNTGKPVMEDKPLTDSDKIWKATINVEEAMGTTNIYGNYNIVYADGCTRIVNQCGSPDTSTTSTGTGGETTSTGEDTGGSAAGSDNGTGDDTSGNAPTDMPTTPTTTIDLSAGVDGTSTTKYTTDKDTEFTATIKLPTGDATIKLTSRQSYYSGLLWSTGEIYIPIAKLEKSTPKDKDGKDIVGDDGKPVVVINVIQYLKSDFFFYPPMDNSFRFWNSRVISLEATNPTTDLEPNGGTCSLPPNSGG